MHAPRRWSWYQRDPPTLYASKVIEGEHARIARGKLSGRSAMGPSGCRMPDFSSADRRVHVEMSEEHLHDGP
jgi:hypothetical protein